MVQHIISKREKKQKKTVQLATWSNTQNLKDITIKLTAPYILPEK
jgi:hypothetical protein